MLTQSDKAWCCGFFEGQASFSVGIGLPKSGTHRYVVFKPCIDITNTDYQQISFLKNLIGLNFSKTFHKKRKFDYHNKTFTAKLQNFDDIEKVIEVIKDYKFKSRIKKHKFKRFLKCYEHIKRVGHIHKTWDDDFRGIINEKLDINKRRGNISKNRFPLEEWETRIKDHLNDMESDENG